MIGVVAEFIAWLVDTKFYISIRLLHEIRYRRSLTSEPLMGLAESKSSDDNILNEFWSYFSLSTALIWSTLRPSKSHKVAAENICFVHSIDFRDTVVIPLTHHSQPSLLLEVPFWFFRRYDLSGWKAGINKSELWLFQYIWACIMAMVCFFFGFHVQWKWFFRHIINISISLEWTRYHWRYHPHCSRFLYSTKHFQWLEMYKMQNIIEFNPELCFYNHISRNFLSQNHDFPVLEFYGQHQCATSF